VPQVSARDRVGWPSLLSRDTRPKIGDVLEFTLRVLSPRQIRARSYGEQLFRLLLQYFPDAFPERFGQAEPLKTRFDRYNVASALDCWGRQSFVAKRSEPKMYFQVNFWPIVSKDPRHSSITFFGLETEGHRVASFLADTAQAFQADYAFAHPLTHIELEDRLKQLSRHVEEKPAVRVQLSERVKNRIERTGYISVTEEEFAANIQQVRRVAQGGAVEANRQLDTIRRRINNQGFASVLSSMILRTNHTVHLRKYLDNLYWLNVFGDPYISFFGRERLRSAPVSHVRELKNGISLRVNHKLEDNPISWSEFKAERDHCKTYLNCDAFFDPSVEPGHKYRAPDFVFT
jgi:hypothetical protein